MATIYKHITKEMYDLGYTDIGASGVERSNNEDSFDYQSGTDSEFGFSIKPQRGNGNTLLKGSGATNFIYQIKGYKLTEEEVAAINSMVDKRGAIAVRERTQKLYSLGCNLDFIGFDNNTFKNNLMLIDSRMAEILQEALILYYRDGISDLKTNIDEITRRNTLGFNLSQTQPFYEHKIKNLLIASALGMQPSKVWRGQYEANGGYLMVKDDGE